MILNSQIWKATISAAMEKTAEKPAWQRAIGRAVVEIERAKYWAFNPQTGVLTLLSTTSGTLYTVDAAHTCPAGNVCKHKAARLLLIRYHEALNAAPVSPAHAASTPDAKAAIIAQIETAWQASHPTQPIYFALLRRFGVSRLDWLPVETLRQIAAAFA